MEESFYDRLEKLATKMNYSQADIMRMSGIPQSTLNNWKGRRSNPIAEHLLTLATLFNVSPYYLLYGTKDEKVEFNYGDFKILSARDKQVVNDLIKVMANRKRNTEK